MNCLNALKMNRNSIIAGVAAVCVAAGLWLSHLTEPGVRVENVTLTEDTPALKFVPAGAGPHPVALLAHGYASSKEALFRYGEALAAAGFTCYSVDQPGHGASPGKFSVTNAAHTLQRVAREIGPVDVFVGWSLGGYTGAEAVREGGLKPGLFIGVGSLSILGDNAPPLLLLFGRFDEGLVPENLAYLKERTDARVIFSSRSDHFLEGFDPVLVNAAVEAACASVHQTPPPPPTAWRWRLVGAVLAMLAAAVLAGCLADLFPRLARFRGLLIGGFVTAAFMVTIGGRWLEPTPHFRLQIIALPVTLLLAVIATRLRIPRWSFVALGVLVMAIAIGWFRAQGGWPALILMAASVAAMPALIAGAAIGWFASRRGSQLQGNLAMAIFMGCAPFQCMEMPRTAPKVRAPIIKLDTKLLDACTGKYEIVPDEVFGHSGTKVTISRKDDHLIWQAVGGRALRGPLDIYPESETNFLAKINGAHLIFIKDDQGKVTGIIHHMGGLPDSEIKKLE